MRTEKIHAMLGLYAFVGICPQLMFFVVASFDDFIDHFHIYSYQIMRFKLAILCITAVSYTFVGKGS
jgi:hypothetical protein